MKFSLGEQVVWTSRGGSTEKEKQGHVEAIIKADHRPNQEQRREADAHGLPRDHESYLIRVPAPNGKGKGKLYWPLVANLRKVES